VRKLRAAPCRGSLFWQLGRLDSGGASPILLTMSSALREPERPVRRFDPCLPRPAKMRPAGTGWIHEIKHDGFRIVAHCDARVVRLVTRNGYDFADRFPLVVEAITALPARSCVLDGEAIAVDDNGLSVFDLIGLGDTIMP